MTISITEFAPLLPEIFMLTMACVILIVDLYLTNENRYISYILALATMAVAGAITFMGMPVSPEIVLSGSFVNDPMAVILKTFVYLITAGVFIYSREYLVERGLFKGEFYVLVLFAVLGMMVMISAPTF